MRNLIAFLILFTGSMSAQTTVYSQNFDALTVGTSAGWTQFGGATYAVGTTNPVSAPNSFGESTFTAGHVALYTGGSAYADLTMQFSQKVQRNGSSSGNNVGVVIRGDAGYNNAYLVLPDFGTLTPYTQGEMIIFKRVGGVFTALNGSNGVAIQGGPYADGTNVTIKVQVSGTTIQWKTWVAGNAEPGTWGETITDASVTAAGYAGLYGGYNQGGVGGQLAAADDMTIITPTTTALAASPSTIVKSTTGNVITLTGTGTSWTAGTPGSPTFTLSGGTGASITAQSVVSSTSATVTLTAGSATGALTITDPSTSATATVTVINSSVSVAVTDANVFWSPYTWYSNGSGTLQSNNVLPSSTYVQTVNWGSYFKGGFTGTAFTMNVDTSMLSGNYPKIIYSVDNGAWTAYTYTGSETSIALATGLASGSHTIETYIAALDDNVAHWTTPASTVKITGFSLDSGAATVAPSGSIAIRPKVCINYGDSITEGEYNLTGLATGNIVANGDSGQSYAAIMDRGLNCEWGNLGFGGTGWVTSYAPGGVPAFPTTYSSYFAGASRLVAGKLVPTPDYMTVNDGRNDSSSITATVISMAATLRGTVNTGTPIFIVVPFAQTRAADIASAFTSITDPFIYQVNLGAAAAYGLNGTCGSLVGSQQSYDSCHPKVSEDAILAAQLVQKLGAVLNVGSGPGAIIVQ